MQIQCPHCKSRYHLGDDMVDAYGGFVRCGSCDYKFNIHDQVTPDDSDLINTSIRPGENRGEKDRPGATRERVEPRLERDREEDELNILFRPDEDEDEDAPQEADTAEAWQESREPSLSIPSEEGDEAVSAQDREVPVLLDELDVEQDSEFSDTLDELTDELLEGPSIDLDAEDAQREDEETDPVLFSALDDFEEQDSSGLSLINQSEQEDEPEAGVIRRFIAGAGRLGVFLFWLVAAIALAYLLVGQVKNDLYPAYKNHPLVQQARTLFCDYLPCIAAEYDPDLYEIVVSRMDEAGGSTRQLNVSIFLLNRAEVAQAYPSILLSLKTIDGSTIAQRVINPYEYFTSEDSLLNAPVGEAEADRTARIKPNKLGKILIKLNNPPAEAVGFEAQVVK